MTTPYDERISKLVDQYRRQREDLGEMQREIRGISSTASAAQQAVRVTVDAQGEIVDLAFPTGAYRRMAPAELSAVLLATIRAARAESAEQMREVLERHMPAGGVLDVVKGAQDWSQILPVDPPEFQPDRALLQSGQQGTDGAGEQRDWSADRTVDGPDLPRNNYDGRW